MDSYDSFINDDEEGDANSEPNKEEYQVILDSPEIYDIINISDLKRTDNSNDQYIGSEVLLPNRKSEKIVVKSGSALNMMMPAR